MPCDESTGLVYKVLDLEARSGFVVFLILCHLQSRSTIPHACHLVIFHGRPYTLHIRPRLNLNYAR